MTAQEFANSVPFPVLFMAGVGCPGGQEIAILPETEFPFELDEVEGDDNGTFEASNLQKGTGWRFSDVRGSTIYKLTISNNESLWKREYSEFYDEEFVSQ